MHIHVSVYNASNEKFNTLNKNTHTARHFFTLHYTYQLYHTHNIMFILSIKKITDNLIEIKIQKLFSFF